MPIGYWVLDIDWSLGFGHWSFTGMVAGNAGAVGGILMVLLELMVKPVGLLMVASLELGDQPTAVLLRKIRLVSFSLGLGSVVTIEYAGPWSVKTWLFCIAPFLMPV